MFHLFAEINILLLLLIFGVRAPIFGYIHARYWEVCDDDTMMMMIMLTKIFS